MPLPLDMALLNSKIINLIIVLLIFSLTGFTSVFVSGWILEGLNLKKWSTGYILGILFIITPVYQVLLLAYAALFGKFRYFLEHQKKIFRIAGRIFRSKRGNQDR
jgi:hypothetical protein